ncbi:MAG: hypothetical protein IIU46_09875, partial [Treponema sp.]|nr:hypothetical protein [Treponema sp.]
MTFSKILLPLFKIFQKTAKNLKVGTKIARYQSRTMKISRKGISKIRRLKMANEKSVMEMYLSEVRKIPLLTREEENDLATKAASGDMDAR